MTTVLQAMQVRQAKKKAQRAPVLSVKKASVVVNRVLNRKLETKFVTEQTAVSQPVTGAITAFGANARSLIPAIQRWVPGSTAPQDWQLVDNEIQPLRITTDIYVCLNNSASSARNVLVTVWVLEHKACKSFALLPGAENITKFLKNGNTPGVVTYASNIVSHDLPVNDDNIRLLKKYTFQLTKNAGDPFSDSTAGQAPNVAGQSYKHLTYTYKCKTNLKYSPGAVGTNLYPQNKAPFFYIGYANIDGTPDAATNEWVTLNSISKMTFKDA
jgi:hypothetical protein